MADSIQTTLGALVVAEPALARLADVKLPIKAAYHVAKLLRLVKVEAADFQTQRNALIQELGEERDATKDEQDALGQTRIHAVLPAHYGTFADRMQELASVSVELALRPLVLDDLGSVEVSARDLEALGPCLVDPTDVPAQAEPSATKRREQKRSLRMAKA